LRIRKLGRLTMIDRADAEAWFDGLSGKPGRCPNPAAAVNQF
jgi:hypothetical protein